ncbi:CcdC family protein [Baia soyae]|uniref:Membrane protein CcdC involved in cytochrome C biogenesis n=1 Tax=Baia soyae TaxID=1544746 RepID=A0A4V2SYA9_9BACL|nr:cytochrome c biogenesis protein CcdC [Baia soyae]TCP69309.1 membrane protein CcdC involved in cytochrome C biogenesis [Baia soyae]
MEQFIPFNVHIITTIVLIVMACTVMIIRIRATKKPTSAKKILIPPLGMSTGFAMFLFPFTRIPWSWALIAFVCGFIFLAIPLILTSNFQIQNNEIYLKRSKAFLVIIVTLLIIRLSLHNYIEQHISIPQTAGVFFILAFGMLLPWRIAMYRKYKKVEKNLSDSSSITVPSLSLE